MLLHHIRILFGTLHSFLTSFCFCDCVLQMPLSRGLLARLLAQTQPQLQAATATDLALLAWGLGTLGVLAPPSSSSSSTGFSSSSSSRLLGRWLSEFMYCSYRAVGSATARDVACLLVGVVRMRLQPGELPGSRATAATVDFG